MKGSLPVAALLIAVLPTAALAFDSARGAQLFANTCEMCHPDGGNALSPDKPLRGARFAARFASDKKLFAVIRNGVAGTVMSPFSRERLTDDQVNDIIAYIRTLTPPAACRKRSAPAAAGHRAAGSKASAAAAPGKQTTFRRQQARQKDK